MSGSPGVLLAILPQHTSVRDRPYLSGWLGKARLVAFAGEPDARGDPTWELYVAEPEPREGPLRPPPRPSERDSGSGTVNGTLGAPARLLRPLGGSPGAGG
jgi:hypothetical protein